MNELEAEKRAVAAGGRALYSHDPRNATPWEQLPPFMRETFEDGARAVIAAARVARNQALGLPASDQ